MRRLPIAIASLVALGPALALAQPAPLGPPPPPAATPTPPATAASPATPDPADPSAGPTPLPALTGSLGGYSWGPAPKAAPAGRHWARHQLAGPEAALPGFEELADGASRLFVELTKTVQVDEHKGRGTLMYVLKGAHVRLHNNTNALVTVHFNTPVTRARLVPQGGNTLFVIDLRADVTATWKLAAGKSGSAVLQIEFPSGNYLGGAPAPAPSASR